MVNDLEHLRAKFLKNYASVPDKLREEVIAIIDDKTYSWNGAFVEINGKTKLGDRILKGLKEIGLFNEG